MPSESKTSKRRVNARQREAAALELRRLGASYRKIAADLGYRSVASAYDAVARAFARLLPVEDVEAARQVELDRLDLATHRIMSKVSRGELAAIDRLIKLSEQRAKLAGLYAPTKTDLTSGGKPFGGTNNLDDAGADGAEGK